jgi:hypothetical protein
MRKINAAQIQVTNATLTCAFKMAAQRKKNSCAGKPPTVAQEAEQTRRVMHINRKTGFPPSTSKPR